LSDFAEIHQYFSEPLQRDTDGDGIPDGAEVSLFKTSPVMEDTDGDGANDYQEIATGGRNPRLAELPQLSLELHGDPLIQLTPSSRQASFIPMNGWAPPGKTRLVLGHESLGRVLDPGPSGLKKGDLVLLATFGAGFTSGSLLLRWTV
jgi:hypothetical protein